MTVQLAEQLWRARVDGTLLETSTIELPVDEDFETLSGLIFHQLGNVPQVGDRVDLEGVALTVLEADERTVKRVKVEVPSNGHDVDEA